MPETVNISFKQAVNAARFIIKSRTGVAILKNNYQQKSDPVAEKNAQLLRGLTIKEMRKLERDKRQFVSNQSEKFKDDDKVSGYLSPRTTRSPGKPAREDILNEMTRKQRPRVSEACQSMKYNTEAVLYRKDFVPVFEKRSKMAWPQGDNDDNEQDSSKTPTLTRKKMIKHNIDSTSKQDKIELWLNDVAIANIERQEASAGRNRKKRKDISSQLPQRLRLPKCEDDKSDTSSQRLEIEKSCTPETNLKLPKLGESVTPDSSHERNNVDESLKDPRFTRLMNSLSTSKHSLKLPQIKPNSRAA